MTTKILKTTALTQSVMNDYYANAGKTTGRKVAWATAIMPTEIAMAAGMDVIFPESYAASCSGKNLGAKLIEIAEAAGQSQETCSYTRAELGVRLGGTGLYGGLPRPDVLLCCTSSCTTVLKWFADVARHFDCEMIVIDMPFNFSGEITEHSQRYIVKQLQEAIKRIEAVTGEPYDMEKLTKTVALSQEAGDYYKKCLELGTTKPSPMTTIDILTNLAPITCLRGTQEAVDVYKSLYEELSERVAEGYAAAGEERYRIVWDNIPFWFALGKTMRFLSESGAVLVGATYLYHWVRELDPKAPLETLAREFATSITLNQSVAHKIDKIAAVVKSYQADGLIIHANRSCKADSLGVLDLQREITKRLGIPAVMVDGDHTDPRAYSEGMVQTRIQAFLEAIDASRETTATAA